MHPDDVTAAFERMDRAARDGMPYSLEFRAIYTNGSEHPILGVGRSVGNGRCPMRFVGFNNDASSRTEAGEPLGLCCTNPNENFSERPHLQLSNWVLSTPTTEAIDPSGRAASLSLLGRNVARLIAGLEMLNDHLQTDEQGRAFFNSLFELPDGSRIQVVAPPATRGPLALAIRRHVAASLTLQDYEAVGHFSETLSTPCGRPHDERLRGLVAERRFAEALALAVRVRKNIIVSGGTSTGKTTFLNALLREVSDEERLIVIEDTPELAVVHDNFVGLVSVRGELGEARVTTNDLVSAALRMRPDRIILGELRGPEAFSFLRAVNSGHPGSMTTIHADDADSAVEQLAMLVLEGGTRLGRTDVQDYVRQSVDVFVQLSRSGGRRSVDAVLLKAC